MAGQDQRFPIPQIVGKVLVDGVSAADIKANVGFISKQNFRVITQGCVALGKAEFALR
ncbi:hypothetical protein I919_14069 [Corynebacterium glutamicum ZL-2]|nr:hypothetical protein C628_14025 [[Brevibacterium] flavum ZL-1]PST74593.1 hypothetical protein I919_14069 [Corynebacterium glutamicum ZL-2]